MVRTQVPRNSTATRQTLWPTLVRKPTHRRTTDWLPLGVFALTKSGQTKSDVTIQLAVNKQGIIRGNYTDATTKKTQTVPRLRGQEVATGGIHGR